MDDPSVPDDKAVASPIATLAEIRAGSYYDSVVLMLLQRALAELPGVLDAGVVMGTPANKALLAQSGLLTDALQAAAPEDLILVVKAESESSCRSALARVDELLATRRSNQTGAYRPKSLASATRMIPEAEWVLTSVPGRYAAGVAREALNLGKNVFLYSDNVSVEDELSLKDTAASKGLLVMGPDCGTARVNGIGLGFANRVRKGRIGIVAASGTGLQTVMVGIHRLGCGVSQAYGTGGRDLSAEVRASSARHALALLKEDAETDAIVIVSKPPEASVAKELLSEAASCRKPVVINFIGYGSTEDQNGAPSNIRFARTLDETAEIAVRLTSASSPQGSYAKESFASQATAQPSNLVPSPEPQGFLRGLYSGGTLAYEALFLLQDSLPSVRSNGPLPGGLVLDNPHRSEGHTIIDLGGDAFTVGRLHPMLDNELRIRRLLQEAQDPETGLIVLDVVLGDGAHEDPATELAPAIEEALGAAAKDGRALPVVAIVIGTDADPQGLDRQVKQLERAGACVFTRHDFAMRAVAHAFSGEGHGGPHRLPKQESNVAKSAERASFAPTFAAINVGLETFTDSLRDQGAEVVHVDWRPPAGGDERLASLLTRLR
ncbi:MAG: acyl-CoA synthetase FdrA [Caldilineaceae bacterium]|nr:acyl-CoA synthetase FdrA [Caldilineaceae bacterium]